MTSSKENNINAIEEAKSFEAILNYQKDWIGKKTKLFAYSLLSLSIILAIAVAFLVSLSNKKGPLNYVKKGPLYLKFWFCQILCVSTISPFAQFCKLVSQRIAN